MLGTALSELGFSEDQVETLARLTGDTNLREYGATYSDLVQRFLPQVLLEAFPDNPVDFKKVQALAEAFIPTVPFQRNGSQ